LFPLTNVTNKHLFPVGREPMIYVDAYRKRRRDARILLKRVPDPQCYGVTDVRSGKTVGIEEKLKAPKSAPKSDLAVAGIFLYDAAVYDVVRTLKPSRRGELEITDVNNHYFRKGLLRYDDLKGWSTDEGTFESLHANELIAAVSPL
jgi:glucose-1-phosphate thymidylyltransferase